MRHTGKNTKLIIYHTTFPMKMAEIKILNEAML